LPKDVIHLQAAAGIEGFGQYYADTECNRKQNGEIKIIINGKECVTRIVCDLLLHGRGCLGDQENLVAIEVKKDGRCESESASDRNRLIALTKNPKLNEVWSYGDSGAWPEHVCGYVLGAFTLIDRPNLSCEIEYYTEGKLKDKVSRGIESRATFSISP
jgi:hypothetical protein